MYSYSDLRPYQLRAVKDFTNYIERQAVMPMGSGKTVTELTAIAELIGAGELQRAHIIAPKAVALNVWAQEAAQWDHLAHLRVAVAVGTPKVREAALTSDSDVVVSTFDNIKHTLSVVGGKDPHKLLQYVVVDEISKFKDPTSKRLRSVMTYAGRMGTRHGLTGTFRPNGWEDQFGPLKFISNRRLWGGSFTMWQRERMIATDYHQRQWVMRDEWLDRTRNEVMQFTTTVADEDLPQLPPLVTQVYRAQMPGPAAKMVRDVMKDLVASHGGVDFLVPSSMAAVGKAEQITNGFIYGEDGVAEPLHDAKFNLFKEVYGEERESVLIAYWFREDRDRLQKYLGGVPDLGSDTPDDKAAEYIRLWNAGEIDTMLIHPASAGHGLNLQHGGARIIVYTPVWSAELQEQLVKRLHRSGQQKTVTVTFLACAAGDFDIDQIKIDRASGKIDDQEAERRLLRAI